MSKTQSPVTRSEFDRLSADALPKVRAVVWRMIGHPEDCEDIVQSALLKAWDGISTFDRKSMFSTWLVAIAARTAVDHLRAQKRWRRESQIAFANLCASSQDLQGEVMAPMMEPEFTFDVKEHVAYCFVCIGRSLEPQEQAALILRDVMDLSAREASNALGVSDSVLRHQLSGARANMEQRYKGLCALISKTGICHQCEGLSQAALAVGGKATALPDIDTLAERIALVRDIDPGNRKSISLHEVFFRNCKNIEEQGIGGTAPKKCD